MLRDGCSEVRDLAIIDILVSTGMRVGELVKLDIAEQEGKEAEAEQAIR